VTLVRFGCETARTRAVRVNGLRLHVLEWGTPGRPALCFLHGGAAHAHWFDLVTPAFADRFHVIALDQRGHGESQWAGPAAYATQDFVGDLVGVMDTLGWQRVTVVGHSMGGHNAMVFAAWHPERVSRLVIVDSRPAIPPERLDRMHARGRREPKLHPDADSAVRAFRLLPRETAAAPELLAHLARAGFVERGGGWVYRFDPASNGSRRPVDAWPLLGRIAAPTLIVRGELSPVLPRDMTERLRVAISTTVAVEIAGAYHHLVLDNPAAFVQTLAAFLAATVDAGR